MKIGIVGGGIGGLAATLALGARGHEVMLVERDEAFAPVGAGIVMAPNAVHGLARLGVTLDAGVVITGLDVVDRSGARLQSVEAGRFTAEFGPTRALTRPALHGALRDAVDALRASGAGVDVRLGTSVLEVRPTGAAVDVVLERAQRREEVRFDVVVGADGLRSFVRGATIGEVPLRFSGTTCWRGVARASSAVNDRAIEAWGGSARVGLVPVGGGDVYYFLVKRAAPREPVTGGSVWSRFEGFGGVVGEFVAAQAEAGEPPLHHDLFELDAPVFGRDRVVLIGDASHGMTPNQGQGAAMAIEDAIALARVLDVGAAGAADRLRAERLARVRRVQLDSRRIGEIAHWESGWGCAARNWLMRALPSAAGDAQYRALVGPGVALARMLEPAVPRA